jgi:splicing factor 3B subunit 3
MFLYNLTLQAPNAINQAILGNFSGTRQQELIVSHVSRIELLRPDTTTGKVHSILSHDVFGVIRSLAAFRLTGASKGNACAFRQKAARVYMLDDYRARH